jgi:hypothetical protein
MFEWQLCTAPSIKGGPYAVRAISVRNPPDPKAGSPGGSIQTPVEPGQRALRRHEKTLAIDPWDKTAGRSIEYSLGLDQMFILATICQQSDAFRYSVSS